MKGEEMEMRITGLCSLLLLCSGCASVMCGDDKTINVNSEPPGATFEVVSAKGDVIVQSVSPTNVTLKRGRGWFAAGDYTVRFHKAGYDDLTVPVKQGLETGWYLAGNTLIFGGLLGLVVVDPLTGAMWNIKDVDVTLAPQSGIEGTASENEPVNRIEKAVSSSLPGTNTVSENEYEYHIKKDASGNFLKDANGNWIIEYVPRTGTQ